MHARTHAHNAHNMCAAYQPNACQHRHMYTSKTTPNLTLSRGHGPIFFLFRSVKATAGQWDYLRESDREREGMRG